MQIPIADRVMRSNPQPPGRALLILGLALVVLAACPRQNPGSRPGPASTQPAPAKNDLIVWCDPALETPLAALSASFTASEKLEVKLVPMTHGELLALAQGASKPDLPDVIVYADPQVRAAVLKAGWIDEATSRTFAGDRLVLIEREDGKLTTASLFDLYRKRFTAFGLLDQNHIEGYYGMQALVTEGVHDRIKQKLKEYPTLPEISAALAQDEVQIALVLASEAVSLPGIKPFLVIGEDLHEDIRYQAAQAIGAGHPAPAQAYLRLLSENPAAQQQLVGFGLLDRQTALEETK